MNNSLYEVLTVTEAAQQFHVLPGTIRYHIDRGNLEFRKTERVYLISLASLVKLYGIPPKTVRTSLQHPN